MSAQAPRFAPGWPGIDPRWTSSAKSGVGAALHGRVWFTISHGILNEVYYPQVDRACTRDLGLIVTDRGGFFSEEKRHTRHTVQPMGDGVPGFHITNECLKQRYRIEKEIIADPRREVVLQRIRFTADVGTAADYSLFAILAPHLNNRGRGNTAWTGDVKGIPLLFAERDGTALALASSSGWRNRSAGFVGVSDGWQDLQRNGRMHWTYDRAENGNVALTGELGLDQPDATIVLALGFGRDAGEAAHRATASLREGFDRAAAEYVREWEDWQQSLRPMGGQVANGRDLYRVSTAVLRTHESARFPGGIIASLSIPWGASKGDDDLGGYHLVWPRDLVECAGGLLAAGAHSDARRVLHYLAATQEADGHWPQNMWLDGTPYWNGIQMDETGFPILLVDLLKREGALDEDGARSLWPMVRLAASFLVRNGPVTPQDRWEEEPGYSPFTLAVEIAALLCAADLADQYEPEVADYLRQTADAWNAGVERWTYVRDTDLSRHVGVDGYYVRIAPPEQCDAASPASGFVTIKNRPPGESRMQAVQLVSPDALALVRFGLRDADDPRIVNTVKVIDSVLKKELPAGELWHRYNGDGYGEHDDGAPFDGTGTGRLWPLLAAERAHYEIAAGRYAEAVRLKDELSRFANEGGLLPEQIWDSADVPARGLFLGRPSGSAMPLAWAHAEYIKLCRSVDDSRVFDTPPQPSKRYRNGQGASAISIWKPNHRCRSIAAGQHLRVELRSPARVRWSLDDGHSVEDTATTDTGLGVHLVDLPTTDLPPSSVVRFRIDPTSSGDRVDGEFVITIDGVSGKDITHDAPES